MVPSDFLKPTNRSGQPELHETNPTAVSNDNEINSMPSGEGNRDSPLLLNSENSAHARLDSNSQYQSVPSHHHPLPTLQIRTDISHLSPIDSPKESDVFGHHTRSSDNLPQRTLAAPNSSGGLSPVAAFTSPQLVALRDLLIPLPSPTGDVQPWSLRRRSSDSLSRISPSVSRTGSRNKQYPGLDRPFDEKLPKSPETPTKYRSESRHERNRSWSYYLHREQRFAPRSASGIVLPPAPPTPPRSSRSGYTDSDAEPATTDSPSLGASDEIFSVRSTRKQELRKYRKLRQLGKGAFSLVYLAERLELRESGNTSDGSSINGVPYATQRLVAVKVIEYGPAGGADEERLEVSLKREVDILKSVNHPSLVQLKAFGSDEKHALLVLDYCPGGDLFDVASSGRRLSAELIRRMFAELVDAVRYLHKNFIVHRDIKLENVLVNLPPSAVEEISDWRTYDRAVVTLSDLGLSRRIPEPPESPYLHTRCGSVDYAAPEILMGQAYDGRLTDAWALGVLLYAMMESRLPFDVLPGTPGNPKKHEAKTPHRIARIEWEWYRYAGSDREWDPEKGKELENARLCVEGLLKRNTKRKNLDEIASMEWVKDAIDVPAGLKRGDKEVP